MRISNKTFAILVGGLLAAAVLAAFLLWQYRPTGSQVVVAVNGQSYGSYDLHTDQTVRIAPADGSWYNILTIEGGKAFISESDCDNQICVYTPPLQEDLIGIIVCLPHGVTVELREP